MEERNAYAIDRLTIHLLDSAYEMNEELWDEREDAERRLADGIRTKLEASGWNEH